MFSGRRSAVILMVIFSFISYGWFGVPVRAGAPGAARRSPGTGTVVLPVVPAAVASRQASYLGAASAGEILRVAFVLQPRQYGRLNAYAAERQVLSQASYQANYAPSASEITSVFSFLALGHLNVRQIGDSVLLAQGSVSAFEALLHVHLAHFRLAGHDFLAPNSDVSLPSSVAEAVAGVVGLTTYPMTSGPIRLAQGSTSGPITPDEVQTAYRLVDSYGNGVTGKGENIAVVMSGPFSPDDVATFSNTFGIPWQAGQVAADPVTSVAQSWSSSPQPPPPDYESTLDVEWAHAVAPGATITEYESGDMNPADLLAAFAAAADATPTPVAINMSFGGPEIMESPSDAAAWHAEFVHALVVGATPVAASGDYGAYFLNMGSVPTVSFPANDPFVLSVGGTSLTLAADDTRASESAWSGADNSSWEPGVTPGSGGGCSMAFFDLSPNPPDASACPGAGGGPPPRGVPDVSAVASDLETYLSGQWEPGDGTSFAAPIWSGLLALAAQVHGGGLGWVEPILESITGKTGDLFDVTSGGNGAYSSGPGWDPVTGWGSPGDGTALVRDLGSASLTALSSSPVIAGVVVGSSPLAFRQAVYNGVGSFDIIGQGFGSSAGTVQLYGPLGQSGATTYAVPVSAWSDGDITLNVDRASGGLFAQPNHPSEPGVYEVTVTTAGGETTPAIPVRLSDYFVVTDSGPTPVTPTSDIASPTASELQSVTATAMLPDGSGPDSGVSGLAELSVNPPTIWSTGEPAQMTVIQNGQPLSSQGGAYTLTVTAGVATFQVASTGSTPSFSQPSDLYSVSMPNVAVGVDVLATFDPLSPVALSSPDAAVTSAIYEPVGSTNAVPVALVDANGNLVESPDSISVTPDATATVNGTAVASGGAYQTTLTSPSGARGFAVLSVATQNAGTLNLTVQDTSETGVAYLTIPLVFTDATQIVLGQPQDTVADGVSQQSLTVTPETASGQATAYPGEVDFYATDANGNPADVTLEEVASGSSGATTIPLQAWGGYQLDLSQGPATLEITSRTAGPVTYTAQLITGSSIVAGDTPPSDSVTGVFTPGAAQALKLVPIFPHMPVGTATSPGYDPLDLTWIDAQGNLTSPPSGDSLTVTEVSGPAVTLGLQQGEQVAAVAPSSTSPLSWSIPAVTPTVYMSSTSSGVVSLSVADPSKPSITADVDVDFVSGQPSQLTIAPVSTVAAGQPAQVVVSIQDSGGNVVTSSNDTVALSVSANQASTVQVSDAKGNILEPVQGTYQEQAQGGVATFLVTNDSPGTISLQAQDVSDASVASASATVSVVSADGSGTVAISPTSLATGAPLDLSVTYTAAAGGLDGGTVALAIPPSLGTVDAQKVTSTSGQVVVSGNTVSVTGLDLAAGESITISVAGLSTPSTGQDVPIPVSEASVAGDTPVALASSPSLSVLSPATISVATNLTTVAVGGSVDVSGTVVDGNGTPVPGATVDLSDGGAGGSFSSSTVTTATDGTFQATYTAPSTAGSVTITATVANAATPPTASASLTVVAQGPSIAKSSLSGPAGPVTAGSPATYTLVLQDANGQPITGLPASAFVVSASGASSSSNLVFGQVTETATPGTYTFTVVDDRAETFTVSVDVEGVILTAAPETVEAGTAAELLVAGPSSGVASSSAELGPFTVTLADAYGNPESASADVTVQLQTSSSTGEFAASPGGQPISTVVIAAGATSQTFFYGDERAGAATLQASSQGLTTGSLSVTVVAAAPQALSLLASPQTVSPGSLVNLSGTVTDAYGNPVSGAQVELSDNGAGGTFAINPVTTDANGAFTSSYKAATGLTATQVVITGQIVQASSVTASTTLAVAPSAATLRVALSEASVHAGDSVSITATLTDSSGNPLSGVSVTFSDGGAGGTFTPSGTAITGADGTCTVTYTTPVQPGDVSIGASATWNGLSVVAAPVVLHVQPPPLAIVTSSLPLATAEAPYQATLEASGGVPPYQWSAAQLPPGLQVNSTSGVISGVPTATGTFTLNVSVEDTVGNTASQSFTLVVASAPPGQGGQSGGGGQPTGEGGAPPSGGSSGGATGGTSSAGGGNGGGQSTGGSSAPPVMTVNGDAAATLASEGGVTKISVDAGKLSNLVRSLLSPAVVFDATTPSASLTLPATAVESLTSVDASFALKATSGTLLLPASELDLTDAAKSLDASVDALTLMLSVQPASAVENRQLEDALPNGQIVSPPVSFSMVAAFAGKQVPVSLFPSRVAHVIPVSSAVNTGSATGVVLVNGLPQHAWTDFGPGAATIESYTDSTYAIVQLSATFRDIGRLPPPEAQAIRELADRLVMSGVGHSEFAPSAVINRGQFALALARALGLETLPVLTMFKDITSGALAQAASALAGQGYVKGFGDGSFRPALALNRLGLAVVLARVARSLGIQPTGSSTTPADASSIPTSELGDVLYALDAGLVSLDAGGRFLPYSKVSRGDAALAIWKLMESANIH